MDAQRISSPATQRRDWPWVSFVWGLAEATFFFVVPDVYLTRLALRESLRRTLLACLCALVGALLGGTLLWYAATKHDAAPRLLRTFSHLPGINRSLIGDTGMALYRNGPKTLLAGGLIGQPYKLFAVHAGAQKVPLAEFLLVSVAARSIRFALTATLAWLAALGLKRTPKRNLLRLHTLVWLGFYTVYFLLVR